MTPGARACFLGLALLVTCTESGAAAPPPDPPTQGTIVPPTLARAVDVPYPAGATGDATVVLAITVDARGGVRAVRVLEGDEPFRFAAVEAAQTWTFAPATRDGRAVAAIIRFEVRFAREPAPAAPARAEAPHAAVRPGDRPPVDRAEGPESRPDGTAIEVDVTGSRRAPAVTTLTRAEVRQLPGAFGDAFRAVEALPGVTPIASGVPFFYVRGAPPGNVGYFLDGVRVPYLYHVGLGPSVVHPAIVDHVDLYPGGYPAQFGRFAGGIVAGETTVPRTDLHGEANVRLFDAGALVEGGFAGGRGTALVGGRYSYTAALLSLISGNTVLDYRDFQARVSYDVGRDDRLTAFAFGSYDLLGQRRQGVLDVAFGTEFYRLDLRHDHDFGGGTTLRTAATIGFDQTKIAETRNATDVLEGARVQLRHPLSSTAVLRAGLDGQADRLGTSAVSYTDPDDPTPQALGSLFPARTDVAVGARADVVWDATPRIEVTPGLRLDLYRSVAATRGAIEPRIAARFRVSDRVRVIHAYGMAHQPPSFIIPIPGLTPGTLRDGLQTSVQGSAGVEVELPARITGTATVFRNVFLDMTDALATAASGPESFGRRSLGASTGLELFVRRPLGDRLGGFLSYTLMRSTRSVGRERFPSAFDRTHTLNAALSYDLGRRYRAGSRLVFYTGTPIYPDGSRLAAPPRGEHPDRNPAFYRLDVRLEKRWGLGKTGTIAAVVEVLNVTLRKETFVSAGGNRDAIGPITIPSIGVEATY